MLQRVCAPVGWQFTACGTVEYMAPELIKLKGHAFEVDWWSLGILMYECLHSYTPFSAQGTADDDWAIIRAITDAEHKLDFDPLLSEDTVSMVRALLTFDPRERADAATIRAHPFFRNLSWEDLLNKQMSPPYVPKCSDPFDTSNFEPDIEPHLTGKKLLALQAEPYRAAAEWDGDF